ncbi:monomeric [FeFe] hydrogenase [Propionispora hippei]|uniref:[FeFe] hydrogenase, group B1/B3 n=1 Tax=Propionispora hippei DSM 15287 TaxID=1123003 RepID=A0A1M6KXJ7_9FIRM|nr:monomeric [FeFe] hydrogenase [Propionispora hippei]SHJ63602.1 [FeFe] hydrogenase, group B1/B3 [Propionispora hippei DSM 15287]
MANISEAVKIRREVLKELAKKAYDGTLKDTVRDILYTVVTDDGPRHRCCIYRERSILEERVHLALSQPMDIPLELAAAQALQGEIVKGPVMSMLPSACDRCLADKFMVTDACRNCLAHHCIVSCPKNAIFIVRNRAYIDREKCCSCGRCKTACSYSAIVEIKHPCEHACEVQAITAAPNKKAVIDHEKCVACGACKIACPFGAIGDRSVLVQVIRTLKKRRTYAMLAPSFIGQFGVKVTAAQVVAALRKAGFYAVAEVSVGADWVIAREAAEFTEQVPASKPFMTSSCCPAFVGMIKKHAKEYEEHLSTTVSPMVALARLLKEKDPGAVTVFIGPCIAKKAEALAYPADVDFVLTFEEAEALLTGADLQAAMMPGEAMGSQATANGNLFAIAGGVAQAVAQAVQAQEGEVTVTACQSEGLEACQLMLKQLKKGELTANFMEGMACSGGCSGGPGTMNDVRVTQRLVKNFSQKARCGS